MLRSRVTLFLLLALAISGLLEPARATDVSGTITTQTWTKANSPYHATGTVTVSSGDTLTIEPGVDVLLDSAVQFLVNGTLLAVGTEQDSIRFVKRGENSWGGMTLTGRVNSIQFARISGADKGGGTGGGLSATAGFTAIKNSVISGNQAGEGGGVAGWNTSLSMVDCVISGNVGLYRGGGVFGYPSMVGCTISSNWGRQGGGVFNNGGTLRMWDSVVSSNGAWEGAGFWCDVGALTLSKCTISNNAAGSVGGGMFCRSFYVPHGTPLITQVTLTNCTMAGNTASSEYAFGYGAIWGGDLKLSNTIVWGNSPAANAIGVVSLAATYSDIQLISGVASGAGNINADPLFVDAANGNYRLSASSPCVDTGAPASALDFDNSRADMGARPYDPLMAVESPRIPLRFLVMQNTPNPFNPSTTIRFTLPEAGHVTLAVYDINGRLIRALVGRTFLSGRHEVVWDGRDANEREVASGVYVYRLTAPQGVVTRRMVLVR